MVYRIEFKKSAEKNLVKLEKSLQKRIYDFLDLRVRIDPERYCEPLHGDKKGLHKIRIGDYRVICEMLNNKLVILVIEIGHRREIYR